MTLAAQPTLGDLVSELLTLVGQGGLGVADAATQAQARAALRRAQALVVQEAAWTINRKRVDVALAADATSVDWPDDCEPGNIHRISAVRDDDDRYEWTLDAGITPEDRTSWAYGGFSTLKDVPFKFDYLNDVIEVGPACSSAVTLKIQYDVGRASMVDDGDRPNCDAEAVLLRGEIVFRNQLGGDYRAAIPVCMQSYQEYLLRTKPKQGTGQSFSPGSEWAALDMGKRERVTAQRHWAWRTRRP